MAENRHRGLGMLESGTMTMLDEIGMKEGTDKSSLCHSYLSHYERLFQEFRHEPITFVEIGIFNGASLRTWRQYFSRARVIGIDIDPQCAQHATGGIEVLIGSQADGEFLAEITAALRPDIIIDDGSHRADHILFSFEHLFPGLSAGGCYVVEDMGAHVGPNAGFWRGAADRPPQDDFARIFSDTATKLRHDVGRIEAMPGAIAIWKGRQGTVERRFDAVRSVLDGGKGTADTWYFWAGMLRDAHRYGEAETAVLRAIEMGGTPPWYQNLLDDIRQRAAAS